MIQQQAVKSRVNQPERVLIRSDDDTTNANQAGFFQFQVNLPTPVLDAKRCQIIRTTIPNVQLQIPDYQAVFWYYSLPTATTAPSNATLRAVRLFPSYYQAPAGLAYTPTKNRYISDPNDFVALLNAAAAVGIVMDVNNGEVIALSSIPNFNPNNQELATKNERFNRASYGVYELGSIFKIFTNTIGFEKNLS